MNHELKAFLKAIASFAGLVIVVGVIVTNTMKWVEDYHWRVKDASDVSAVAADFRATKRSFKELQQRAAIEIKMESERGGTSAQVYIGEFEQADVDALITTLNQHGYKTELTDFLSHPKSFLKISW